MLHARRSSIAAVLVIGALVVALVAPAAALALVGEPVEGAEVFLSEQPGDDPIVVTPTASGHEVNADCSVSWPDGAVATATNTTATVGESPVGERATDGGWVRRVVLLKPSGLTFAVPITVQLQCPLGLDNPRAYLKNPGTGAWERVSSTAVDGRVTFDVSHYSLYGIGGEETPVVPASSPWSLVVLVLAGVAVGGLWTYRISRSAGGVGA